MPGTTVRFAGENLPPDRPHSRRTQHIGKLGPDSVALYISNSDEPLIIRIPQQVTLGRYMPIGSQAITMPQPQVDLTPFNAYELGVSRIHAAIRRTERGSLTVEDMMSSNGTFLNSTKLQAHVRQPLASGDRVQLGRLDLEIYFDPGSQDGRSTSQSTGSLPPDDKKSSGPFTPSPTQSPVVPKDRLPSTAQLSRNNGSDAPQLSAGGTQGGETTQPTHYHAASMIHPQHVSRDMAILFEELIIHLNNVPGSKVKLTVQIEAYSPQGFDKELQHTIDENSHFLKLIMSQFGSQ